MTTTLIVLAHPNRGSFNGAWAEATEAAARALGDTILWSDLCAAEFAPVETAKRYDPKAADTGFDPLKAQEAHAAAQTIPADVQAEIDKLMRADRVVFHFPLWWFAPPAILKGWFDRVMVHGALHSVTQRFDTGLCSGKTALFCVSTGASATECTADGQQGNTRMLLWPTAYTLRYLGFTVLEPVIANGVHGYHEGAAKLETEARLMTVLQAQAGVIANFATRARLLFNTDADFGPEGRLLPDSPSHSAFIRHAAP